MQTHFYLNYCLARFTMLKHSSTAADTSTVPYLLFHIDIFLVPETGRHHNNSFTTGSLRPAFIPTNKSWLLTLGSRNKGFNFPKIGISENIWNNIQGVKKILNIFKRLWCLLRETKWSKN